MDIYGDVQGPTVGSHDQSFNVRSLCSSKVMENLNLATVNVSCGSIADPLLKSMKVGEGPFASICHVRDMSG